MHVLEESKAPSGPKWKKLDKVAMDCVKKKIRYFIFFSQEYQEE